VHFDCFFEAGTLAERGIGAIERSMENSRSGLKQLPGASLEIGNEVFLLDSRDGMKELAGTVTNGLALGTALAMGHGDIVKILGARGTCHRFARSLE